MMEVSFFPLGIHITVDEMEIPVIIAESPRAYREIIQDVLSQLDGAQGELSILIDGKMLSVSKDIDIILNPFNLAGNERTLLNKLYGVIKQTAYSAEYYMTTQEILSGLASYFYKLCSEFSFDIDIPDDIDIGSLAKACGIHYEMDGDTIVERIVQYMNVSNALIKPKAFIFVGLKNCLTGKELDMLYDEIVYRKYACILIENSEHRMLRREKAVVIDEDQCVISCYEITSL